jgi:hypothetical protein
VQGHPALSIPLNVRCAITGQYRFGSPAPKRTNIYMVYLHQLLVSSSRNKPRAANELFRGSRE